MHPVHDQIIQLNRCSRLSPTYPAEVHNRIKPMSSQPPLNHSSQSTWRTASLPKRVVELDEHNQELLLGGSPTGEDTFRARLTAKDVETISTIHYGIMPRSIPTLM